MLDTMRLTSSLFLIFCVNITMASSYLYVSSNAPRGEVELIQINETTGEVIEPSLPLGVHVEGIADFAIHNGYLYAPNPGGVEKCALGSDGSLKNCEYTGTGFSYPNAIMFQKNQTNHTLFAYIGNKEYKEAPSSISRCTVNLNDGSLANCTIACDQVDTPISIDFYKNFAYIVNAGKQKNITQCMVSPSGDLTKCHVIENTQWTQPRSIVFDGDNAYIADATQSTIAVCSVNEQSGSLKNCKPTGNGFAHPNAVRIYHGRLYVTNYLDDSLSTCQIQDQEGSLNDCFKLSHYFNSPYRMIIYESQ